MCFLKSINAANMLIRDGNKLFKLAPYQLKEILNFQSGKDYKRDWFFPNKKRPYFVNNNRKKYIVYIVD
jgi:hypothetical protein